MKRLYLVAFVAFSLLFAGNGFSQISHGGEPLFNKGALKVKSQVVYLPSIDNEALLAEDIDQEEGASPLRIGVVQNREIDVLKNARMTLDENGRHYLLAVSSPGATFVSLHFSIFQPSGKGELFLYDQSGELVLGSFNASDVKEDGSFYTQAVTGSTVYLEYNLPADEEPGRLVIDEVGHGYKDIFKSVATPEDKGYHGNADGNCHINVACPEGNDWRDQIRATVAIEITAGGYMYMCTGTLVNNTRQDKTPYVLSAYHCQDVGTVSRFVCYFLYQTNTCNGTVGPYNQSVTGATIKAKLSASSGSDFLLLKLNSSIPDLYKPYYAGWNRNNIASPAPGACIHHPGGDYKKISIPRVVTRMTGSYINFYSVYWYTGDQNKGVTEQGSSGSALFDSYKRVIGQLYAGSSSCTKMDGYDLYGRVYKSWTGDGTTTGSLQSWLDPDNTGVATLDGLNYKEEGIDIAESASRTLNVYPNPTTGVVHFDIDAIGEANYKVFDLSGRCVLEGRTILTSTVQAIDLSTLRKGNYMLNLYTSSSSYSAKIVVK